MSCQQLTVGVLLGNAAEDGAGDWMLRGTIRLPADAPSWGGKVVMKAAWESFISSRKEDDQPPSPAQMSPTTTPATTKGNPEPLALPGAPDGAGAAAAAQMDAVAAADSAQEGAEGGEEADGGAGATQPREEPAAELPKRKKARRRY